MIRPSDRTQAAQYVRQVNGLKNGSLPMTGLTSPNRVDVFVAQLIESNRRIAFVQSIGDPRPVGQLVCTPGHPHFNPLKAAWHTLHNQNDLDEALWLVFLATHFGKHKAENWNLPSWVYAGNGTPWSYQRYIHNPQAFETWWQQQYSAGALSGFKFSNHRKYESLRPDASRSTPEVLTSYVDLIGRNRCFSDLIGDFPPATQIDPHALFDELYTKIRGVTSFGRTAAFDFLTMAGNLGILPIKPGKPYLQGATGPLAGAKLLFLNSTQNPASWSTLEPKVIQLGNALGVSMQTMEDALCNWQKSPDTFSRFRG
ncbi:MAG: hypothetical protein ACPG1C_04845 [Alphaproteobacteria bacterium]